MIEIITILHAYLDSRKIKRNEYIDHFWRSVVWFFICLIPMIYVDLTQQKDSSYPFIYLIQMFIIRIGIYDFSLNIFRGLSPFYISKTTGSKIDLFYQRIGINQNVIRIIFLIITITYKVWSLI